METTGAGSVYRARNMGDGVYYRAEYSWGKTPPEPGIYRLAVLASSRAGGIEPPGIESAVSQLRYVTVVFDTVAPTGAVQASISGYSGASNNVYNYSNTPTTKTLRVSADFGNVRDNGGDGIRLANHASNRPCKPRKNFSFYAVSY